MPAPCLASFHAGSSRRSRASCRSRSAAAIPQTGYPQVRRRRNRRLRISVNDAGTFRHGGGHGPQAMSAHQRKNRSSGTRHRGAPDVRASTAARPARRSASSSTATASIRHFLSLILHGAGIDTEEFADGNALRAALAQRAPDLVFLDIPLESAEAIACVVALGAARLSRPRAAHEQPRLGGAGARQEHRRAAAPANAAGAAKAVRDQRHPEDSEDLKLGQPPAVAGRHRSRRSVDERLDRILVPAEDRPAQKTA